MRKVFSFATAGLLGLAAGTLSAADTTMPAAPAASTATAPAAPAAAAPTAPPTSAASDVSVDEISFGTGVQEYQMQGKATEFTGVELVNCLTSVNAKSAPTTIKHVWYKNGAKMGEVSLNIGASRWTTWSNHFVQPGSWKVEVQDDKGTVVTSAEFTVK